MNDPNKEHAVINNDPRESIGHVAATRSRYYGESLPLTTPVARRKRWSSARLIALISLGAIPVIVCLLRYVPAERLEGLGVALCAIACGGFLIRHLLRMMAEEDKLQEQLFNANQATVSPSESNLARQKMNPTTPAPEAGQNVK